MDRDALRAAKTDGDRTETAWDRMKNVLAKLRRLETRLETLERDLDAAAELVCRVCRTPALVRDEIRGPYNGNMIEEKWSCAKCGHRESRVFAAPDDQTQERLHNLGAAR